MLQVEENEWKSDCSVHPPFYLGPEILSRNSYNPIVMTAEGIERAM